MAAAVALAVTWAESGVGKVDGSGGGGEQAQRPSEPATTDGRAPALMVAGGLEEVVDPSLVAAGRLELLRIWEDLVLGACGGQGRVGGLRLERHPPVPN